MSTIETPIGPFTLVVDGDGAVLASGWTGDASALLPLIHPNVRSDPASRRDLGPAALAVRDYHRGDLWAPAAIAVRQHSDGVFLTAAWDALCKVAPGEAVSYTELAARTGNARAVRAAGQACARNAAALFVPCHRAIRTDGSLGGFRWGLPIKQWLLAHEAPA